MGKVDDYDHHAPPPPLYATLGADDASRQVAYRSLFDQVLCDKTLTDIRLTLHQTQPLGNNRFFDAIEQATGERREAKPRGRRANLRRMWHQTIIPSNLG